ncbi:MAG: hypothetical protein PHV23_05915 [Candidatus Gracilibacteria bacterium]|nr:hypothetical protein [Candidatus Gracilibacteria bacterium]
MRNYDFWKQEKSKSVNKENLILILSGIFYKTFDTDARFLSDKFGFKIKQDGGYENIGFPKNVLEKYLDKLKFENYGYIVIEKQNGEYIEKLKYIGIEKLSFDNDKLTFLKQKQEKNEFKLFLRDLKNLIEKYS